MVFACSRWLKVEGRGAKVWGRASGAANDVGSGAPGAAVRSFLPLLQEPKQHAR